MFISILIHIHIDIINIRNYGRVRNLTPQLRFTVQIIPSTICILSLITGAICVNNVFCRKATLYCKHEVLYTGKYSHPFYFCSFRSRCQWANLRLGKFQYLKLISLLKHVNFVWANSRWGETVCESRRAKTIWGKTVFRIRQRTRLTCDVYINTSNVNVRWPTRYTFYIIF